MAIPKSCVISISHFFYFHIGVNKITWKAIPLLGPRVGPVRNRRLQTGRQVRNRFVFMYLHTSVMML